MTILFFSRLFAPHIGGVEKHVYEISQILLKKGHKVIVITENHGWKDEEIIDGIQVYRLNVGKEDKNKKLRIWNELWKMKKIIHDADIVHCHDVFFWYIPFRYLYSEKPIYTTFHGYEGNSLPTKKAILMHRTAEFFSFGNICIGDFFTKWYHTKPTIVTYGAVDKTLLKNKISRPKKDIIFIGRLEEETGIMEYLKALTLLKDKKIKLTLDVYGDGSLTEKAKIYVKDHKLQVIFHGFDPDVTKHTSEYRYVFTSRYLGMLEAMSFKKPIFAVYNNAIKKDYLEMTPFALWISISENAEQIAAGFEKMLAKKKIVDIEKAYDWVKDQSWEHMADLYIKLWNI